MRVIALIAVLGAFSLGACGDDTTSVRSSETAETTAGTSSNPAAVETACKKAFPIAVAANANFDPTKVIPQTTKIAEAADQAGEPSFSALIRDFGAKLSDVQATAQDPAPLNNATAAARAEASKIGAPTCVKFIGAFREAAGT